MSKVLIGMSGGVDSSVASALLMDQGYEVVGVTLKLWDGASNEESNGAKSCCSLEDVEDARRTAFKLNIPFYVLNMKELFEEKVVRYFVDSYIEGNTPNPCIACNRHVKFQAMYDKAMALGMDYIATGHYARVEFDSTSGRYLLKKGVDVKKDQSYVLYMLKQEQLKRILFPLGALTKTEVREIARSKGFGVSEKPDSQDICFVENGDYSDFIMKYSMSERKPGDFIKNGQIIGKHKGMIRYTIGQRKGLGIAYSEPLYVIDKDIEKNAVILGSTKERFKRTLIASDMNYIYYEVPPTEFEAKAKVRYSASEHEVIVNPLKEGKARIEFKTPQPDIAPGQAVVLYQEDRVLGGGVIEKVE